MKYSGYDFVTKLLLFFLCVFASTETALATTFTVPTNGMQAYTQQMIATTSPGTPSIQLEWPPYSGSANLTYKVYKKSTSSSAWGNPVSGTLASTTYTWTDTDVVSGSAYEYQLTGNNFGYLYSGFNVDTPINRGRIILLVESSVATPLTSKIDRLKSDLVGDGWEVVQINVASSSSVVSVKSQLVAEYNNDPINTKALFIIGHVPVPYSGDRALDGHYPDHEGAWPTDAFYADMNGTWTDSTVTKTGASAARTRNIPGDGKYDQYLLPSNPELATGRIDFYNMPSFASTEVQLLSQYLDKDHDFRQGNFVPRKVGLMGDNFGTSVYTSNGAWNNMTGLLGPTSIENRGSSYFSYVASSSYLITYGNGSGTYTSASGVGTTAQYAASTTYGVFNGIFGSYFGDWDSQNNFLKAPLASAGYGLTNMWSGWPLYFMHRMGLGETIGESLVLTQTNSIGCCYQSIRPGYNSTVIGLMGDPTLRLYMVDPASNVSASDLVGDVEVTWDVSSDPSLLGYNILRSTSADGPYELATSSIISGTSYEESLATGDYYYMIRPVKLEYTPSGTFYNRGQGAFTSEALSVTNDAPVVDAGSDKTVQFVSDSLQLNATTTDDGGTQNLTISWGVVAGPGSVYFTATTSTSTIANFSAIGNYTLRLSAVDNVSTSNDELIVIVQDVFDAASPATPAISDIDIISDREITVSWSAPSDSGSGGTASGIGGYEVYRDDQFLATTTDLTYSDTELAQNTEYTYKILAFDNNGNRSALSSAQSGTTEFTPLNPVLTTDSASSISATGATFNGNITLLGYRDVTERGFIYGTSTLDYAASSTGNFSTGAFSTSISDLVCNTEYSYVPYALNEVGYGYGTQYTFTTSACPVVAVNSGGSSGSRGGGGKTPAVPVVPSLPTTPSLPLQLSSKNFYIGMTGNDVTELQKFLISKGLLGAQYVTGYFGPLTQAALANFQKAGVITPTVVNATQTTASFSRTLTMGSSGEDVRSLQKFLNSRGFTISTSGPGSPGNETSLFGDLTRQALMKYQQANNIYPAVGFFGPLTKKFVETH